ncbi:MAG: hypothetical protein R3B72_21185 [Polyangiaceae bacterium]
MKRWLAGVALGVSIVGCELVLDYEPFPDDGGTTSGGLCRLYDADPGDCAGSFRDCNGDDGDGCETDVATAAGHCGYCGHACDDGCDTGLCTLELLGTSQALPIAVYGVHRDTVYFTLSDVHTGITALSLRDGGETVIPAFGVDSHLAFDGDFLYATGFESDLCQGGVGWCAIAVPVGSTTPSVIALVGDYPSGIATTDASVFIADGDAGGRVARVPKVGGNLTPVATGLGEARDLRGTPGWVYWGTGAGLMRASDDGVTVETLNADDVSAVATHGDDVFWAAGGRISTMSGVLVEGVGPVTWLGATDDYLYWIADDLYRFVRCETGAPEVIGPPGVAAVSDSHVYLTAEAGTRPARRQH